MTRHTGTGVSLLSLLALAACGSNPPAAPSETHPFSAAAPLLAASSTGGNKPVHVAYLVSAVSHGGPYQDPAWVSTLDGTTNDRTLFTTWGPGAIVVTPTGSSYALGDDAHMSVITRNGAVIEVTLYIQDVTGPGGIQHETDPASISPPVTVSPSGFVLHVHRDGVPVYRLKGHTGGPRVGQIGTISVGDIVFVPR